MGANSINGENDLNDYSKFGEKFTLEDENGYGVRFYPSEVTLMQILLTFQHDFFNGIERKLAV